MSFQALPVDRAVDPDRGNTLAEAVRRARRQCRSPVAILSTLRQGRPVGCTVSSFLSLSLQPPSLLVSLQWRSRTLDHIRSRLCFGLSMLSEHQAPLVGQFARGCCEDRFRGTAVTALQGVPVLDTAPVAFACTLRTEIAVHDHILIVGDIVGVRVSPADDRPQACGPAGAGKTEEAQP